jgi:phospholipase/lecithinase/hemolysin
MAPFMRARFLLPVGLLFLSAAFAARCLAGPFTNLVVFGDSLSDIGNISQATPFIIQPKTPGPYYWNGRFSNGPIYAETLAAGLGLPALVNSSSGGADYAYGGALTTGSSFPENLVIRDVDDQVNQYTSSHNATANTLYVVFAGANDLIDGQTNMSLPVGSLQTSLEKLYTDGARQFLVINLPPLGFTPRYNGTESTIATANARTQQYNAALATMLAGFQANHLAINLNQLDVYSLVLDARSNPVLYGLTNVTQSAAPGLSPGDSSYDTSQLAPNPNQYLFWDDLHPTTAMHQILGHRALDLFYPAGDYSRDIASDAADYVLFRKGLGSTYVPIDYSIWRAHFGETVVGGSSIAGGSFASAVPEPGSVALCIGIFFLPFVRLRGGR